MNVITVKNSDILQELLQPYPVKTNGMGQTQELHNLQHEMTGWVLTQLWECQVDP